MANIPGDVSKINDSEITDESAVSEAVLHRIGGIINGLNLNTRTPKIASFTTSQDFLVPSSALDLIFVFGIGGGGGGGGSLLAANNSGGGGGSGIFKIEPTLVTPGTSYRVTIGTGGNGGSGANGQAGTASKFGELVIFDGGGGGGRATGWFAAGGAGGSCGQDGHRYDSGGANNDSARGGSGLSLGPPAASAAANGSGSGGGGGITGAGARGGDGKIWVLYFDIEEA